MAKKNFIQAWTEVILGTDKADDDMRGADAEPLTAKALPRVKETLCNKCGVDVNDAACVCDVPFAFDASEFLLDLSTKPLSSSRGLEAAEDWKVLALRDATPYCLQCEKEGHRTDECHSTSGFNNPRQMELARLAWIANGSITAEQTTARSPDPQGGDAAPESPLVSLQPVLPASPAVRVEDVSPGAEIVPWKTAQEWAQAYGDACYAAGKRVGSGKF